MPFPADFYSVAAQIIVVLFVLAAVELKVLVTNEEVAIWNIQGQITLAVGLVVTATIGVVSALASLHDQLMSTQRDVQGYAALLALVVFVFVLAVLNWASPVAWRKFERFVARGREDAFIANPDIEPPTIMEALGHAHKTHGYMTPWLRASAVLTLLAMLAAYCVPPSRSSTHWSACCKRPGWQRKLQHPRRIPTNAGECQNDRNPRKRWLAVPCRTPPNGLDEAW